MKTFKLLIVVFVTMLLIVGLGFMAGAISPKHMYIKIQCPQGWHKVSSPGTGVFACRPDAPDMYCPQEWEYFFDGCTVGCRKITDIPD
jgi:hypothetical protein